MSGLGDDYAPLIERARASRALLIVENESDARILEAISTTCGYRWPPQLAILASTDAHKDRLKFYRTLLEAIDGLKAVSLRDRDTKELACVDAATLREKGIETKGYPDFLPLTWRRREIENYALVPSSIASLMGQEVTETWWRTQGWAWPQDPKIETHLQDCDIKKSLGKLLGRTSVGDFLCGLTLDDVHPDLKMAAKAICDLSSS